jgi:hypothetical protein
VADEERGWGAQVRHELTLRLVRSQWDLDTGAPLLRFRAHGSLVFDVKFDVSKIIR